CRGEEKTASVAKSRPVRPSLPAAPAPSCDGSPVLRVPVQPGDYLHVVADQDARDVALTLFDPRGRQLLRVDGLNGADVPPYPAEEIRWVADDAGELRIELTLLDGSRGPCGLRLAEQRRATAADRRRVLAETELAQAHELRRTHESKACRAGVAVYESAQRRFAGLGLLRRRAEALFGLGQLQRNCLHDDKAAQQTFTRAMPLFAGDVAFEAKVTQHLGELRFVLGDLDGAIDEYRQALKLRRRLADRAGEAMTLSTLGHALRLRGRYDDAAASLDRALALWQPGDGPGRRAGTLLSQGQLHRDLGEADQAREKFSAALELYRQAKNHNGEAAALNALGSVALDGNQFREALQHFQDALALRSPGSRGWAVTQTSLGVAHRDLGQIEEARRAYAAALPIFRSLGDSREQASSLGNLGRLEATAGHDDAALVELDEALALYRLLADPPDLAWTMEGKARVLRRRGDLEGARRLMEEALTAVERHRFSQASYTTRADFFSTQQRFYEFLIDLLVEMHREDSALEVSERSLARSLLDGLAASGMDFRHGAAAPALHARERELETEIDALVSRETRLSQDSASLQLLGPVEADLGRRWIELDRVRAGLRTSDPRYAALVEPQPLRAAEIQRRLLGRDTLLLEYRLGEKRSFLWAVTPGSLKIFNLPGRAEIDSMVRPACDLLASSRSATAVTTQLDKLSRLLLDPVAPLLAGKRLLVVADGNLQSVPFAALLEPGGGEPLIAHHEIVTLPSVSVLGEIRR
ncbi:MAG TPA: tetratricopeptide repeat protein, partial [Thermoanaerobaculia bacterium]|nr:tetratricopeptide repeat protein [Thermoanaerobaculia bacterium]